MAASKRLLRVRALTVHFRVDSAQSGSGRTHLPPRRLLSQLGYYPAKVALVPGPTVSVRETGGWPRML